ncbi:MAG TPA: hypothetical protein VET24_03235 [Actinomycetota bacterium]|nr:hypothetical protein [Actinomycetota bacterium]
MARAHIVLTVEFDCAAPVARLDKRQLRQIVNESVAEGNVSLWDAHVGV